MKFLAVIAVVVVATQALNLDSEWENFKTKYGKNHLTSQEHDARKNIFANNLKFIEKHNAEHALGLHTFTVGINKFADLTNEEFIKEYTGVIPKERYPEAPEMEASVTYPPMPDSLDWREYNVVTEVKDQGQCGSCWAFSTIGTIESAHARRTQELVSLSEQNLVDCVTENSGCYGGFPYKALMHTINNGGVDTEESYPYEAVQYTCRFDKNNVGATITNAFQVAQGDEEDLHRAVAFYGATSVCIDASHYSFQLYQSGVYYEPQCNPDYMEHAVLAVGYSTDENGNDYWIVKNSWGVDWGMEGYINMARNENNHCGIATMASYAFT